MVSEKELEEAQYVFGVYDKKGDGKISAADIGGVIRSLNKNPLPSEIAKVMASFGPNARISFSEFAPYLTSLEDVEGDNDNFVSALRVFDRDGTGYMPLSELRYVLTNLGEKLSSNEVDTLLSGVTVDADGNINYEAFINKVMTPLGKYM